jgi:hypothetical protein
MSVVVLTVRACSVVQRLCRSQWRCVRQSAALCAETERDGVHTICAMSTSVLDKLQHADRFRFDNGVGPRFCATTVTTPALAFCLTPTDSATA